METSLFLHGSGFYMAGDNIRALSTAKPETDLFLVLRPELAPLFLDFFQRGVFVKAQVGTTIQAFLCQDLGLDPQYVKDRIQTVFLNGKAVDDPGSAVIPDDATIALSAAMPGLLGATLRKGSYYAGMRGEISLAGQGTVRPHEGRVLLKLFNLLPGEIGPSLLDRGVWVNPVPLRAFIEKHLPRLVKGCIRAEACGRVVEVEGLAKKQWPAGKEVFLRVQAE